MLSSIIHKLEGHSQLQSLALLDSAMLPEDLCRRQMPLILFFQEALASFT